MGAAGTGITGKKIAGGDFSTANLNAIDKGSGLKSGKSSVVDQMKMTEKEFKTHTAVIRADHARMVAANTRGFGKYYADFIAYLRAQLVNIFLLVILHRVVASIMYYDI